MTELDRQQFNELLSKLNYQNSLTKELIKLLEQILEQQKLIQQNTKYLADTYVAPS